jgi:branched-chain amino acid transport system substrate-binding protein
MSRKNLFKVGALGAVVAILCMFSSMPAHAQTLKLGVIAPLSGPGAPWGQAMVHGPEMAIEDLEKRGGLTINGKKVKVELIPYDDKYAGAEGSKAGSRLVSVDKVKFIIGSISSPSVLAFLPITEKAKAIVLGNCFSPQAVNPKHQYYFRAYATSVEQAEALCSYVVKKHKVTKVALIGPNDETGHSMTDAAVKEYKKLGVEIVYNEFYERTQKDFYPQIKNILNLKADLIDTSGSPSGTVGLIAKQAREMGYKGNIVAPAAIDAAITSSVAGPSAEGIYTAFGINLPDPKFNSFKERFKKKYGKEMTYMGALAWYTAAFMIFDAVQKTQSMDTDVVKEAIENMGEVETIYGKVFWGGMKTYGINHQLMQPVHVQVIRNGKETNEASFPAPKM